MNERFFGAIIALMMVAACGGGSNNTSSSGTASTGTSSSSGGGNGHGGSGAGGQGGAGGHGEGGRGFPAGAPWVSWYGGTNGVDLAKVASTFRIINIDADPDAGNFTDNELQALKANGQNRVISYMNVGACEDYRSYWSAAPPGFQSCVGSGALTTDYDGYPDEKWADLSNVEYRKLIVGYVAKRLADRGVDGFFLDNLEVVEHGPSDTNGPCDAACSQGGLDLVWELRQAFPNHLIVMQNATSDVTRLGVTHGVAYPSILDGISHEEVYSNGGDAAVRDEMLAYRDMQLMVNGVPFWIGVEEYVGACAPANKPAADALYAQAMADGLNAYVTDESGMQLAPCFW